MTLPIDDMLLASLLAIAWTDLQQRMLAAYERAGFRKLGPAYLPVFLYLSETGDRVVDLAKRSGITKQAMGYLVNSLEEQGYVERIPDPVDKRAQLVRRTPKGRAAYQIAQQTMREVQEQWGAQLGTQEIEQLLSLLRQLAHAVLEQREDRRLETNGNAPN
jgi:DNA-binding MarR family transcriptional regulator